MQKRKGFEDWFYEGKDLGEDKTSKLEAALVKYPNNARTRARLLGLYCNCDPDDPRGTPHKIWFIEKHPGAIFTKYWVLVTEGWLCPDNYSKVRSILLRHVQKYPKRLAILLNAACFFERLEPERAEALYWQAKKLKPFSPRVSALLASFYQAEAHTLGATLGFALAKKSLDQYEHMEKHSSKEHLFYDMTHKNDAALMAFLTGNMDKAICYAKELLAVQIFPKFIDKKLERAKAMGVLGRAYLRLEKVKEAEQILDTIDYRPDWYDEPALELSQDFLERGVAAPVLRFLDRALSLAHEKGDWFQKLHGEISTGHHVSLIYCPNTAIRRADDLWHNCMKEEAFKWYRACKDLNFRAGCKCAVARLALRFGDTDQAMRSLERAYVEDYDLTNEIVETYPTYKELRVLVPEVKRRLSADSIRGRE